MAYLQWGKCATQSYLIVFLRISDLLFIHMNNRALGSRFSWWVEAVVEAKKRKELWINLSHSPKNEEKRSGYSDSLLPLCLCLTLDLRHPVQVTEHHTLCNSTQTSCVSFFSFFSHRFQQWVNCAFRCWRGSSGGWRSSPCSSSTCWGCSCCSGSSRTWSTRRCAWRTWPRHRRVSRRAGPACTRRRTSTSWTPCRLRRPRGSGTLLRAAHF